MFCFSAGRVKLVAGEVDLLLTAYSGSPWKQALKREEIMLRGYSKPIKWTEAADILRMSYRHLQRVREDLRAQRPS
jgi:hypothetical protein